MSWFLSSDGKPSRELLVFQFSLSIHFYFWNSCSWRVSSLSIFIISIHLSTLPNHFFPHNVFPWIVQVFGVKARETGEQNLISLRPPTKNCCKKSKPTEVSDWICFKTSYGKEILKTEGCQPDLLQPQTALTTAFLCVPQLLYLNLTFPGPETDVTTTLNTTKHTRFPFLFRWRGW